METNTVIVSFDDIPNMGWLEEVISAWRTVVMPGCWRYLAPAPGPLLERVRSVRERLSGVSNRRKHSRLEVGIVEWLYGSIRMNVKRGRLFELHEVLRQGKADCLGYAKLFTLLGRLCGLDTGIADVIIDSAGRYVPHTTSLVKLADGRRRFVDLWYGSKNIRHRRLGLMVKRGNNWRIEDIDFRELATLENVGYLPYRAVNAITLYVRGNRYLNRKKFKEAIEYYSRAISLYPENARFFFNRAIAWENLGDTAQAEADYAQALQDDSSITRVLAREHNEITVWIDIDALDLNEVEQQIYLLHSGLLTGRKLPPSRIARRLGLSTGEVEATLAKVQARLRVLK